VTELLHDPETHFLGKQAAKPPHVMLRELVDFEKLLATVKIPPNIINSCTAAHPGVPFAVALAMYLNDREGDCTCAGEANIIRVNSDGQDDPTDDEVQTKYIRITGEEGAAYNPQTGENDNGCVEIDVLDDWVQNPMAGQKLLGHAGVDPKNDEEYRASLYLTGSIYPGWALSTDQQSQPIWQAGSAPAGSWGGHCAPILDDWTEIPDGLVIGGVPIPKSVGRVFDVATWQQYKPCLGGETKHGFIRFACDEMHALILPAWVDKAKTLDVVDEQKLEAYLKTLQPEY